MNPRAKLMVATEIIADAELVRNLLQDEFDNIALSTDPDRTVDDFEKHRPEVLVLAFNSLEKAERYYLGLYRLSTLVHALPHRTLILCNKNDLRRVYELCKKGYFDEYILFWPVNEDVLRLPMAVHHALDQMKGGAAGMTATTEIVAQARQVAELDLQLEQYAAKGGQRMEVASRSLQQAEKDIGAALDGFSRKISEGCFGDLIENDDRASLQREIARLKAEDVKMRFRTVAAAVKPVQQWANALKDDLAPQLESVRSLKNLTERVRPVVLVVDDDAFQHKLLQKMLADASIEAIFAVTVMDGFAILRKRRPDLILMDIDLPDVDGVEATRRLKSVEHLAPIPVIMITGHSDKKVVIESLEAGAVDFVVKPFNKDTLLDKVRGYLCGEFHS